RAISQLAILKVELPLGLRRIHGHGSVASVRRNDHRDRLASLLPRDPTPPGAGQLLDVDDLLLLVDDLLLLGDGFEWGQDEYGAKNQRKMPPHRRPPSCCGERDGPAETAPIASSTYERAMEQRRADHHSESGSPPPRRARRR